MEEINKYTRLNDQQIRDALKSHLLRCSEIPTLIIDELAVHNGNAKADLVAFYEYPHCFEIKSDRDTLCRLPRQVTYYDFTFKKNNLVTTSKFLSKSIEVLPAHWGIWLAKVNNKNELTIKCFRKAKINKGWVPEKALLTLWKSELIKLDSMVTDVGAAQSSSRAVLASKIGKEAGKKNIQNGFFKTLLERFEPALDTNSTTKDF
jgi:hypothetical protein